MKLIDNWKEAHKMFSVQAAAVLAVVSEAYTYLPDIHNYLPQNYVTVAAIVIIVARLLSQPKKPEGPCDHDNKGDDHVRPD